MKLYIVENWTNKIDKNIPVEMQSTNLITQLLGDVHIKKGVNGKPFLVEDTRFINWSHNAGYLVIVISDKGNVGVDVENTELCYDEELYGWVLHAEEKRKINTNVQFSEIWTRKEAILKYSGEGISEDMSKLNSYAISNYSVASMRFKNVTISICSKVAEPIEFINL